MRPSKKIVHPIEDLKKAVVALLYFAWPAAKLALPAISRARASAAPQDWNEINYRVMLSAALAIGLGAAYIAFHEFDLDVEIVSKAVHDQYMRVVELRRITFFVAAAISAGAFLYAWRLFYSRVRSQPR